MMKSADQAGIHIAAVGHHGCDAFVAHAVPMRVGEFSTRVQEVNLRLYAASTMYQPKPEVCGQVLCFQGGQAVCCKGDTMQAGCCYTRCT